MHLGNGAITPGCAVLTYGAAAAGLGTAAFALRRTGLDRSQSLTAGAQTAAIFAAQLVNVPVLPFSSAHLVGGVLASWVLGPALGALSMAVVLTGQALLLGDGGLLALGANIINMALLPASIVVLARRRATVWATGCCAAGAVVAASLLIVGETALFRSDSELTSWPAFAVQMIGVHCWIAIPEGLLTVAILKALGGVRAPGELKLDETRLGGCWGVAVMLVLCLLPLASRMPDGYEASAVRSGATDVLAEETESAAFDARGAAAARWQNRFVDGIEEAFVNEQALALAATLCVGLTALLLFPAVGGKPAIARKSRPVR